MRTFRLGWLALMLCVSGASRVLRASPPGAGWTLAWSDEFSGGSLDTSKWFAFSGSNQGGYNDPDSVTVSGGHLVITTWTNSSSGVHHTGWVSSQNGFQEAYGYWEASIRFNESPGEWSAFWLQPDTINTVVSPADPATYGTEVDVVEHRRQDSSGTDLRNKADINLHWNGYGSSEVNGGPGSVSNPGSTSLQGNWHTYGVWWTSSAYYFYINNTLVATVTSGVSMRKQFIYLSTFVNGSSWAGAIPSGGYGTSSSSTTKMEVDYVRFYQRAERVINGDFEAKVAPFDGGSLSSTSGRGGSQGVKVASSSSEQTVYGLRPNTDYVVTGWGDVNSGELRIGAKSFGGSQTYTSLFTDGFNEAATLFTTGATNTTARIFAWSPSGNSYVDDMDIYRAGNTTFGSFENGNLAVWDNYGSTSVASDNNFGGSYALKYTANNNADSGAEEDVFGLQPNTTYRLSAWTTNGNLGLYLGVKNYGGTDTSNLISANTWTRGRVDFTTGSTNTSARIYAWRPANADTATMYADDFFICEPFSDAWTSQDVGAFTLKGTAGRRGSKFVLQASGNDIWGTSDHFHFAYQQMTGDCQITARVRVIDDTDDNAKIGVMMREGLNSYVRHVMVNWAPSGEVQLIRRTTTNGTSNSDSVALSTPPWVRLVRRNNTFTGYYSTDGTNWQQLGSPQTLDGMLNTIYVGLPACSHDETVFAEAIVDNVELINLPPAITIGGQNTSTMMGAGAPVNMHLTAVAVDDGLHGTITPIGWQMISGPKNVTFSNPSGLDTSVLFPVVGTYVLQASASNSVGIGTAQITVMVTAFTDSTLKLRLKLDESNGTTATDSAGSNAGTLNGGYTWQPSGGVLKGAISLDGTSGYVDAPDAKAALDNTSAFTLAYWFKANALSNSSGSAQGLVSKRNGLTDNNAYTTFLQTDGLIYVDIDTNDDRFASNTVFTSGKWYHVALVYDGSQASSQRAKLFVNGVLDTMATESSASIPDYSSSLKVGLTNTGGTGYLSGMMDDVRYYQRALSATEIAAVGTGNFAPTVSTGNAPSASSGVMTALAGSVSSDVSGPLSIAWSVVSGPGTVTFGDAATPTTTVKFNAAGTYVLRLTGTNSVVEVSKDLTVNVSSTQNLTASSFLALSLSGLSSAIANPQADADHDGVSNLVEYALGMDPASADAVPWKDGHAGLPNQNWINVSGTDYLSLQVRRPVGLTGITYSAEVSGDFTHWSSAVQEGTAKDNGDGSEIVIFRDTIPRRGAARRFIRLKITQP